jgi:hypothetical protein
VPFIGSYYCIINEFSIKMKTKKYLFLIAIIMITGVFARGNTTYYIDSQSGNDNNTGTTPDQAWKSLEKSNLIDFTPGTKVLLKRGSLFQNSKIVLEERSGTINNPIVIGSYGAGELPIIDMNKKPEFAFVIAGGSHIVIENLEMKNGMGGIQMVRVENKSVFSGFTFRNLYIHDMFTDGGAAFQLNPRQHDQKLAAQYSDILIENCRAERINRSFITGDGLKNCTIRNNVFSHSAGPGMVLGLTSNLIIRGNIIDSSGSRIDPNYFGRGSCGWIIYCTDVLVEKNKFMNAQGWLDSYGFHLDIGNKNCIIQYNLSMNNSGGFVQILGRNKNCVYRYNLSINDGYRRKGDFDGRFNVKQNGCAISLNGYVAKKSRKFEGPYNSYIYNNTIYTGEHIRPGFTIRYSIDGALIANNIFYFKNEAENNTNNRAARETEDMVARNAIFDSNLFLDYSAFPSGLMAEAKNHFFGDPGFHLPGGTSPENYLPLNESMVKDKGVEIYLLPDDDPDFAPILKTKVDYFGNPIEGMPDLGAIELIKVKHVEIEKSDTHD